MAKKQNIQIAQYEEFKNMILEVRDNGGRTMDRYTVVYDELATTIPDETKLVSLGMDDRPFHPSGFCQHGEAVVGDHLGQEIDFFDLPFPCQFAVMRDFLDTSW